MVFCTDHKPLEVITREPLNMALRCLYGMHVRALAYDIEVRYEKQNTMFLADTLSGAYISDDSPQAEIETLDAVDYVPI